MTAHSPEVFEQATITPVAVNKSIAAIRDGGKLSYDDIFAFFAALRVDISKTEDEYKVTYPGWARQKFVLTAADHFFQAHKTDEGASPERMIFVTSAPDGSINHVGWKPQEPNEQGFLCIAFDPDSPLVDDRSLSMHLRTANQFDDLRFYVDEACAILKKLAARETLSTTEWFRVWQLVEIYAGPAKKKMAKFFDRAMKVSKKRGK